MEEPEIDLDTLCERTMAYLREAPDSPVKDLVDALREAMAYTKRGLLQAIETVDNLERTLQDYEAEDRYLPIRCRLRADGQLMIHSADDGTEGHRMFVHLIQRGYIPVDPTEGPQVYLEDEDEDEDGPWNPYWNPEEG